MKGPEREVEMSKKWMLDFGRVPAALAAVVLAAIIAVSPVLAAGNGLTAQEVAGLNWMREEEKLARDVYIAMYAKWGASIFGGISRSEQGHMDAVKTLLDRYGLPDPASAQVGVFNEPTFRDLYPILIARGNQSLSAALQVGIDVENIDIADLKRWLAQTNHADIQQVYNNLLNGSYHHLSAFTSWASGGGGGGGGGCRCGR